MFNTPGELTDETWTPRVPRRDFEGAYAGALAGGARCCFGALAQALHARGLDTDEAGRAVRRESLPVELPRHKVGLFRGAFPPCDRRPDANRPDGARLDRRARAPSHHRPRADRAVGRSARRRGPRRRRPGGAGTEPVAAGPGARSRWARSGALRPQPRTRYVLEGLAGIGTGSVAALGVGLIGVGLADSSGGLDAALGILALGSIGVVLAVPLGVTLVGNARGGNGATAGRCSARSAA